MTALPSGLGLAPVDEGGFSLTPSLRGKVLAVKICGNGDMAALDVLNRYLKQLHREAVHLGAAEVELDFHELYFMNSSCLKALVSFIDGAANVDKPGYRIRFLTNPQLFWQRRSLEALQRLAPEFVQIES